MAAIHAGVYDDRRLPEHNTIIKHFRCCQSHHLDFGNIEYMGIDEQLREVYFIGARWHNKVIRQAQASINKLHCKGERLHCIDARNMEKVLPHVISFLLKYDLLKHFCGVLFVYWFRRTYKSCAEFVADQKELLNAKSG